MTLVLVVLFSALLCLVALRVPALGLGLAAAADLVLMEGVPVGGTTIAIESFYFLYLLTVPLIAQLVLGSRVRLPLVDVRPFFMFALAFLGVCALSALQGGMRGNSATVLSRLPLWIMFGIAPIWLCRTGRDVQRVAVCVVAGCVLLLGLGVLQGLPSLEEQGGLMRNRYLNPLGHAMSLGCVLSFGLFMTRAVRGVWRSLPATLSVVFALAVLWTGSRGSLLSCALGVAAIAWVVSPGRAKSVGKLAGLAGASLLVFAFATGYVQGAWGAFLANDASSNLYRYQIGVLATRLFLDNPLLGVGLGGMEDAGIFQAADLRTLAVTIIASDNDYARVLAELGALGMGLIAGFAWFVRREYRVLIQKARSVGVRQNPEIAIGVGLGANLLLLGLFESVLFSPTGWFYLGLVWACTRVKHNGARGPAPVVQRDMVAPGYGGVR